MPLELTPTPIPGFGAFLYRFSQIPRGQRGALVEQFADEVGLHVRTVLMDPSAYRYIAERKLELGIDAAVAIMPGDVPEPVPEVHAAGDVFAFTSDEALVLLALEGRRYLTLAEIAERTGLPPHRAWHAVHRLLNYKRVMPAIARICLVTRSERPTFKACYNL